MYQSIFAPKLVAGQVIVVTSAGSGIGRCTAHELASLGAHVVLVGRKGEKLQAVLTAQGRLDGLVNNAGGQYMAPLEAISAKGWEAVLSTNLTGGFLMARECYRQAMAGRGGRIVNIVADMWGSMPGMGHSGAARAGMVSLTESAALEWACQGVPVNAVAPGYIASSGMDHYPPEAAAHLRAMRKMVPLGRFGNEVEVSAAIVFLLSPAASFISGSTLRVDGARPQMRPDWPMALPDTQARQRSAVREFGGFHRAVAPRVFQDEPVTQGSAA